jgi:intracellular sulfur oxidation DsrE/DsrF family protein
MPRLPAAAAHPSQFKHSNIAVKLLFWLLSVSVAFASIAQEVPSEDHYYVVDIELQTVDEFRQLLERAEQLLLAGVTLPDGDARVTLVLHGPVLRSLLRENYLDNKNMVDRAASLSAMEVIDVKACNTWMASNSVNSEDLQPFIETVAYGPAEVKRLIKDKHYLYF